MRKNKLVTITEQSFQGAGGTDLFGKLEMVGPVCAIILSGEDFLSNNDYNKLNETLVHQAKVKNADYVFGVEYLSRDDSKAITARGTAYRKRSLFEKFFSK